MNIDNLNYKTLDRGWHRADFSTSQADWAQLGRYDGRGDNVETERVIFGLMQFALANDLPYQCYPSPVKLVDTGQYESVDSRCSLFLSDQIAISVNTSPLGKSMLSVIVRLPYKTPHFICECARENESIRDVAYEGSEKLRLEGEFGKDYESHVADGDEVAALQVLTPDVMTTIIDLHPERLELRDSQITMIGLSLDHAMSGQAFYRLLSGCRLITGEMIHQLAIMNMAANTNNLQFRTVGPAETGTLLPHEMGKYLLTRLGTFALIYVGYVVLTWSYWMERDDWYQIFYGGLFCCFLAVIWIVGEIGIRFWRKRK